MTRLIGYARISMNTQNIEHQIADLQRAGCEKIFSDEGISGASKDRPGFDACMAFLEPGDMLVVYKLDRLARSIRHLIDIVGRLNERGIAFKSISEAWLDTTNPQGRFIFHIFAALAEFERELIIERTKAGLEAAWARGSIAGHPFLLSGSQIAEGKRMLAEGAKVKEIAAHLNCSVRTVHRRIRDIRPFQGRRQVQFTRE
jgi:DNA invertase Pin-like site-specific DNA recombinase